MIVMKFGGTSNQDANAMRKVVDIIFTHRHRNPIVVISAIAQGTNALEQAGKLAANGDAIAARDALHRLFTRHHAILDELVKDHQRHSALERILSTSLQELEEMVKGLVILKEITPRILDSFYAYGELSSSRLVAAALQEKDIDAEWIDTKDFMITDENHTAASPVMESVETHLSTIVQPLVEKGIIPVTQGFIGVTSSGHRTTMGRESSDYSASIIGFALRADEIQIWTDVDGVLTADPRVVRAAKRVKILSFEEAFELSYFGAKVLHPNTMLPAVEKRIPIFIFNSRKPQSKGTLVTHTIPSGNSARVKSIASKQNLTLLTLTPRSRFSQYIFWEHMYSVLTRHGVCSHLTGTSEYNVTLVIDRKDVGEGLLSDLSAVGAVDVQKEKGILSVVGSNVCASPDILARLSAALRGSPIAFISYGASKSSIALVVNDEEVEDLVRKLHGEFFEGKLDEEYFEELERDETNFAVQ